MTKNGSVLVCVTAQRTCRKLIECGFRLAEEKGAALRILSVFPQNRCTMPDIDALEMLNSAALEFGAEMTVCFSDDLMQCVREAISPDTRLLVTGFPGKNSTEFIEKLRSIPTLPLCMVDSDGTAYSIERKPEISRAALRTAPTVF